jgi:Cu/Ag efflux pump CusA
MRRLMAAAALAVLCATATACSDSGDSSSASATGGSATASAAATTAAGSGNTKQICADAQKVVTDATTKFTQELTKVLANAANGSDADAVKPIKNLFTEWADGLRELADRATDGQLKSALNDTADQIAKVAGSIKSATDLEQADKLLDTPEVQAAEEKFEKFCG